MLKIPYAVRDFDALITEAKTQLHNYQQTLQQKYGATLKLRTFTVVAIGLERLVWEEKWIPL